MDFEKTYAIFKPFSSHPLNTHTYKPLVTLSESNSILYQEDFFKYPFAAHGSKTYEKQSCSSSVQKIFFLGGGADFKGLDAVAAYPPLDYIFFCILTYLGGNFWPIHVSGPTAWTPREKNPVSPLGGGDKKPTQCMYLSCLKCN